MCVCGWVASLTPRGRWPWLVKGCLDSDKSMPSEYTKTM